MWIVYLGGCLGGFERSAPAPLPLVEQEEPAPEPSTPAPIEPSDPPPDTTPPTEPGELAGFVGSSCTRDADCPYEGGVCLSSGDGWPGGTCSAPCTDYCDDAVGFPTTFCVAVDELPSEPPWNEEGGCVSRCDFLRYPFDGCRDGYGCNKLPRVSDPTAETWVCLPGSAPPLPACLADLAERGVPFTFPIVPDASPADAPELVCHVEEPIEFHPGYLGVDLQFDYDPPAPVVGACNFGQSLADSIEGLVYEGVVSIHHYGTTVCRTIAGTDILSRHAYGDAIDLASFEFDDGTVYSVLEDWEIDDPTPEGAGGIWLYDTAWGWHEALVWNVILTPDYNAAHANHLHVDLTPGSDFLGFAGPGVFGPSPWPDE